MLYRMLFRVYLLLVVLSIAACGGGGSGGGPSSGSSSSGGNTSGLGPDPEPIVYNGVSSAAVLANDNIAELIYSVFSEYPEESTASADSSNSITATNITKRSIASTIAGRNMAKISDNNRTFKITASEPASSDASPVSEEFNEIENCDSGTIVYNGDLDEDSIGHVVTDYRNCVLDGVRTNGRTRMDIYEYDLFYNLITNGGFEYKRLTTAFGEDSTTISGTVNFHTLNDDNTLEEDISNIVIRDDNSGKMIRYENFTEIIRYYALSSQRPVSYSMSGRVYDGDHGYVNVETLLPILTKPDIPLAPAYSGQFRVAGASNTQAVITLLGEHILFVELDRDGDDLYEQSISFDATQLLDWVNGDITDSDRDGIPDRWEERYGLDPQTSDSGNDFDSDGVSNLDEYIRGTAPNNPAFLPPVANLRLIRDPYIDPFRSGGETTQLVFLLQNNGPDAAGATFVRIKLPVEFRLNSIQSVSRDACSTESNGVFCIFENLDAGVEERIVLDVTFPSIEGDYPIDGEIHALAANSDSSNNQFQHAFGVRPPSAELNVTLTDSRDPVAADNLLYYSAEIINSGDLDAESLTVAYTLPAGTTIGSSLPTNCEQTDSIVTCGLGLLSAGSQRSFSYSLITPETIGEINSSITASSTTPEFDNVDNNYTQTTRVIEAHTDFSIKTYGKNPGTLVGSNIFCWFDVQTHGPDYVNKMQLSIDMPPEITPILESTVGAYCSGYDPVTCTATLDRNNTTQYIRFPCTSLTPGIYNIQATVSSPVVDDEPTNNIASTSLFFGQSLDDIQSQIDIAADGATIIVPPGFYIGSLLYSDKTIRLISSDGPDNTYFCGAVADASRSSILPGAEGEISGFTFTHSFNKLIKLSDSNVEIRNNIFEKTASYDDLLEIEGTSRPVIEKNIIRNNKCSTATVIISSQSSPVIRNNLFENNTQCAAIKLSGPLLDSPGFPQVINNTIVRNGVGLGTQSTNGIYSNNIIYDNSRGIYNFVWCEICDIFQSNLIYNNDDPYLELNEDYFGLSDQTGINGNISADPLFVDPDNSDYRLSIGSPAIDAGDATYAPEDDLLGNPRTVDGNGNGSAEPDIGAFEYQ